jgi:AcrR family transcriptional regulator
MTTPSEPPARHESARATRQRILDAAGGLMLSGGYAQMTIAELAKTAGVSAQTIYNSVGGKAEVVKAVYDVTLAGDVNPEPMSDRPEFRAMTGAADLDSWTRAYAVWSSMIFQRVGPLLAALLAHGPGGDPVLEQLVATMDTERRTGNEHALHGLMERGQLARRSSLPRMVDSVWVLTAPEVYDRLVHRSGWSVAAYENWLATQLRAALADDRSRSRDA